VSIGKEYVSAQGTIILSFGVDNTPDDVEKTYAALKKSVDFLRSVSPFYKKKEG